MKRKRFVILLLVSLVLFAMSAAAQTDSPIERVSVSSSGRAANGESYAPAVSADGRWVAFESYASNLVSGDTNSVEDVFVYDRETRKTTRISHASNGSQGNSSSFAPSISSNGRWIAFESDATNLVNGDINGASDIFVHDRETGKLTRVSVSSSGSQGNEYSTKPAISGDGRWVVFEAYASNLVSGDTNATTDIFVHDRETGETTRVSVASDDSQSNSYSGSPAISENGRWVAFESGADNLVSGDTNGVPDIFVHDRQTGETTRVSVATNGDQSNNGSFAPAISGDGRWVAFESYASNLVSADTNSKEDVFLHDRETGETTRVSVAANGMEGNNFSYSASVSGDGLSVIFESSASNLVVGDTNATLDIFLFNQPSGAIMRVSVAANGAQANSFSDMPSISADGRWLAFRSPASNLVSGDTNNVNDVFLVGALLSPRLNNFTTDTPTVTWNRVSWATGYEIEIDTDPNFGTIGRYVRAANGLSHLVDTPLAEGVWYWRVRAVGASGAGSWSVPERFVVDLP